MKEFISNFSEKHPFLTYIGFLLLCWFLYANVPPLFKSSHKSIKYQSVFLDRGVYCRMVHMSYCPLYNDWSGRRDMLDFLYDDDIVFCRHCLNNTDADLLLAISKHNWDMILKKDDKFSGGYKFHTNPFELRYVNDIDKDDPREAKGWERRLLKDTTDIDFKEYEKCFGARYDIYYNKYWKDEYTDEFYPVECPQH